MSVVSGRVVLNTSTPSLLVAAEKEITVSVKADGSAQVFLGGSTLSSTNGFIQAVDQERTVVLQRGDALYALADSGTPAVRYLAIGD